MKKLMVFGLLISFLLSACAPQGSDTPTVGGDGLQITTKSLPVWTAGISGDYNLEATGGTAPYTWKLAPNHQMPNGFTLSEEGVIVGNPPANSPMSISAPFRVIITDSEGNTAEASYSITIAENTDLTGTWSGPYTLTGHVSSGGEESGPCTYVIKGTYTLEIIQDKESFSGTVYDDGTVISTGGSCPVLGSYSLEGTVEGTISGSAVSGSIQLPDAPLKFSGRVSNGKITATQTGVQPWEGGSTTYSGSFTLEKQS